MLQYDSLLNVHHKQIRFMPDQKAMPVGYLTRPQLLHYITLHVI